MDPPSIVNELEAYLKSLEDQEMEENLLFRQHNIERDQQLYTQEDQDEVDLMDGQ